MGRLIAALLFMIVASVVPVAQAAPGTEAEAKPALTIVGKNAGDKPEDFRFRVGESLSIKATGDLVDKVAGEWAKTKSLALYLDGVHIADLKSPPQVTEPGKELLLNFALIRNADDDANRAAWDSLFRQKHGYLFTLQPSLAIGGELPLVVHSAQPFQLYVASGSAILLTLAGCVAAFLVGYWYLATRTQMLFETGLGYYSLGKSQMVFWGLLVLLSFVGVWTLTGTMERIPPQVLILLGISGATGLSAVVIGNSKKTATENTIADKQANLAELKQEESRLNEQQDGADRLATVRAAIDARSNEIDASTKLVTAGTSRGFWQDICDDGNGVSFHRLQVVIWTMVLGAVFIRTVAQVMSMPEFPETLLSLMGISNATYLGFKIPEKQ